MTQHYPQQPGQPGWGGQQQPGQQPTGWAGPGAPQQWGPPPQPPKKTGAGKIIGLGCLGIIGLFVLIGIIAAVVGGNSGDDKSPASATPEAGATKSAGDSGAEPEKPAGPMRITAKQVPFKKSILADGSAYTSVSITIAATGKDQVDVNPLYCSITDSTGSKHTHELAMDEDQLDAVKLAAGEKVTGTITGKGKFTPKYVACTDGLIGDPVRADVS
ncbi:hypothetical protein ACGFYT_08320 [Streptomyces sp. NPDC048208]|uniref:hypothetical protein n=1 Tax=Streptomyces sp. NPDC048208 TaxID=3365515 RepID=UPI003711C686